MISDPPGRDFVEVDNTIWSKRMSADLIPDGDLDKQVWTDAQRIRFDRDAFVDRAHPNAKTSVATLWTPQYLYIAYWCKFARLHMFETEDPAEERWELWHRDVVEAFIAPSSSGSRYYEFEVAPNNQWLDLEIDLIDGEPSAKDWDSGFVHATQVNEALGVWTAEMRIPVQGMGFKAIDSEFSWRINFCRCDGSAGERRLLSWCTLNMDHQSFHQPERFGMLRFADF